VVENQQEEHAVILEQGFVDGVQADHSSTLLQQQQQSAKTASNINDDITAQSIDPEQAAILTTTEKPEAPFTPPLPSTQLSSIALAAASWTSSPLFIIPSQPSSVEATPVSKAASFDEAAEEPKEGERPAAKKLPKKRIRKSNASISSADQAAQSAAANQDDGDEQQEQPPIKKQRKPRPPKAQQPAKDPSVLDPPDSATASVASLAQASFRFQGGKPMVRKFGTTAVQAANDAKPADSPAEDGENKNSAIVNENGGTAGETGEEQQAFNGPRVRIMNGKIVVDQSSLQLVHDPSSAEATRGMEQIVEHQETRRITSATFMKRAAIKQWTAGEIDKFYEGLRRWGTDFTMITTQMFPSRSRRNIKLLFNREERSNPARIDHALRNPLRSVANFS
jgi:transcription factor TFIIIB component B''